MIANNDISPSTNGDNGRGKNGRFVKGNKGGPGNPLNQHACKLRAEMLGTITGQDMVQMIKAVVKRAKKGDVIAFREVCDRCFGKSKQGIEVSGADGGKMIIQVRYVQRSQQHAND